ncbi:MAG: hypothetical protein KBG20_22440, partial [Caldilineaceae bacterium]|nr:hypothetical protein [Caldilineaceae bacterium]
ARPAILQAHGASAGAGGEAAFVVLTQASEPKRTLIFQMHANLRASGKSAFFSGLCWEKILFATKITKNTKKKRRRFSLRSRRVNGFL